MAYNTNTSGPTSAGPTTAQTTSNNSLQGYGSSGALGSSSNPLSTSSIGVFGGASSILNPYAVAQLVNFTSLDGGSVLSISNRDYYKEDCDIPNNFCRPAFALEKHITVVRKGPTMAPQLEMFPYEDASDGQDRASVQTNTGNDAIIDAFFTGDKMHQSSNWASINNPQGSFTSGVINGSNFNIGLFWGDPDGDYNTQGRAFDNQDISMFYKSSKELVQSGDSVNIPIDILNTGEDWEANDQIIIEHEYVDSIGNNQKATARLQIINTQATTIQTEILPCPLPCPQGPQTVDRGYGYYPDNSSAGSTWASPLGDNSNIYAEYHIEARVMSITGNFPMKAISNEDLYNVFLVQKPPIFELKFPKFSYRYKYEDGEYSVFGPWSEIAFIPGQFDYLPKKGYNLGMQNKLRRVNIKNWVPKNIPKDVVQVDILYKESNSPNIYTVSSHKKDDPIEGGNTTNYWNMTGNGGHNGFYTIKSELIHKVVKSNQLLRPWDNVPRKALAQEITANRLIFANYVQNFDLKSKGDSKGLDSKGSGEIKVNFTPSIRSNDYSTDGVNLPGYSGKSLKSMRTYQLGVVYRDRYGRETPVMTSKSGSIKLSKQAAKLQNRLSVQLHNKPPYWAESFTFYIKETSNEYYNLAMDRWYDAEDGGVWLSFPSSERNKITDRTNLILKKQHDTNIFTDFETSYKVLSLKNDAPTFIKTDNKYWGSLPMMLPPPGWGSLGTWDSYNTRSNSVRSNHYSSSRITRATRAIN